MSGWSGRRVTTARAQWRARIAAGDVACCRCGKPVRIDPRRRDEGWQLDHWPIPREHGGTQVYPAHAHCNMRAGGKRGAEITNARRARTSPTRLAPERERGIRGI